MSKKKVTPEKLLQKKLDQLSGRVKSISMSFSLHGTRAEQLRMTREFNRLSEEAQSYVAASALYNLDHFGAFTGVFILREQALKDEILREQQDAKTTEQAK